MKTPLELQLEKDKKDLNAEVSNLHHLITVSEKLLLEKDAEIKSLRSQIENLTEQSAYWKKMYGKAARLCERITTSQDVSEN